MAIELGGAVIDTAAIKAMATNAVLVSTKALIVLVVGILLGKILAGIVKKIIKVLRIEETLKNLGVGHTFLGFPISELAELFVKWYVYLVAIAAAFNVLNVPELAAFIEEIKSLLPPLAEAMIIAYVGYLVAGYIKKGIERSVLPQGKIVALVVYYFVLYLTAILAFSAIYEPAATLLNYLLLITVGAIGLGLSLGLGLAIGLGTKGVVEEIVRKHVK